MTGGAGADVFEFGNASRIGFGETPDVITDFEVGIDKINLEGLSTVFSKTGFIGGGQDSFVYNASLGQLQGDVTGNGGPDWILDIGTGLALTQDDFVL